MQWNYSVGALLIAIITIPPVILKMQQQEEKLSVKVSFGSAKANGAIVFNNEKQKPIEVEETNNEKRDSPQSTSLPRLLWARSNDNQSDLQRQSKAITTEASKTAEKNDAKDTLTQLKNNKDTNEDKKHKRKNTKTVMMKMTTKPKRILAMKKERQPASEPKSDFPARLIYPFGQLSEFLSRDRLQFFQDYRFLFHAERDTVFRLHSPSTTEVVTGEGNTDERVFDKFFGAAAGANSVSAADCPPVMVQEVRLYDAASLRHSRFSPFNPTRILIHGWFGGSNAGVYKTLVPEYLKLENGTFNVFTVDWGRGAIADYITASYRVKPVGKVLAKFIDFLHRESGMRFEDLHVIGFSMGAHVAGIAGKFVQTGRLPIIYALDPALPLFRYENINERIALTDADYVEVIHTSVGSYGYDRPLGHVDFYVNYGSGQPGCFFNECNHIRAFQVFAESLQNPNAFVGHGCDVSLWSDLIKNRRCLMGTGRNLTMGGNLTDLITLRKRGGGVYYFENSILNNKNNGCINTRPPYGQS